MGQLVLNVSYLISYFQLIVTFGDAFDNIY